MKNQLYFLKPSIGTGLYLIPTFVFICVNVLSNFTMAFEADVLVYSFQNKGANLSKKIKLSDTMTELPIDGDWFDWKCQAEKQVDGIVLSCAKGEEKSDTKIFCYYHGEKEIRYLRIYKGESFISLETKCHLSSSERKKLHHKNSPTKPDKK